MSVCTHAHMHGHMYASYPLKHEQRNLKKDTTDPSPRTSELLLFTYSCLKRPHSKLLS